MTCSGNLWVWWTLSLVHLIRSSTLFTRKNFAVPRQGSTKVQDSPMPMRDGTDLAISHNKTTLRTHCHQHSRPQQDGHLDGVDSIAWHPRSSAPWTRWPFCHLKPQLDLPRPRSMEGEENDTSLFKCTMIASIVISGTSLWGQTTAYTDPTGISTLWDNKKKGWPQLYPLSLTRKPIFGA